MLLWSWKNILLPQLSPFIIQGYNDKVRMNLVLTCPTAQLNFNYFKHKMVYLQIVCLFGNINTLLISERAGNKSSIPTNESALTSK